MIGCRQNPYQPPSEEPSTPLQWDHSILIQAGVIAQSIVMAVCGVLRFDSDVRNGRAVREIAPSVHLGLVTFAAIAFLVILLATLAKRDWPLRFRLSLVALDLAFIAVVALLAFESLSFFPV